jgi:hypothetical protein
LLKLGGRLKGLLLKNPNHGFSKGIILINIHVRLAECHKEFLDNSSEGSLMLRMADEAWELLDKIFENTNNSDLVKGNKPTMVFGYKCVEIFSILVNSKI